jgi:hypothetical protein
MATKLTVTFIDPNNKPLAGLEISVGHLATRRYQNLATGKTTRTGTFAKIINIPANRPKLVLRVKKGTKWLNVDVVPVKYTATIADFGKVTYGTTVVTTPDRPTDDVVVHAVLNVEALNLQINALKTEKQQLTTKANKLQSDLNTLKGTHNSTLGQINVFKERNDSLTREISGVKAELLNTKNTNKTLARQIAQKDALIKNKDKIIAELNETIANRTPSETLVDDVYFNTIMQLKNAQAKIKSSETGFALGKVSMNLKVIPGATGNSVAFPDKDSIKEIGAAGLSDLTIEFVDIASGTVNTPAEKVVKTPELIGLTQTMASRKLRQLGFDYTIREEYVGAGEAALKRNGCVLGQDPPAGTSLTDGTVVSLTIGKSA